MNLETDKGWLEIWELEQEQRRQNSLDPFEIERIRSVFHSFQKLSEKEQGVVLEALNDPEPASRLASTIELMSLPGT
jgi:hypothetical protein